MPQMRCNLLIPKPFASAFPAGMACALSRYRGRGVPHATSETYRWREPLTGGHRPTVITGLHGVAVEQLLTHGRGKGGKFLREGGVRQEETSYARQCRDGSVL
jgi:hypothetical protein